MLRTARKWADTSQKMVKHGRWSPWWVEKVQQIALLSSVCCMSFYMDRKPENVWLNPARKYTNWHFVCLSIIYLMLLGQCCILGGVSYYKTILFPFTGQMRDLPKYQREICQSHEKFSIALTLFLLYFTQDVRKITNYCMTPESYLMSFICCFWEIWHYYMKCAALSFWFMFYG